jgi:hypothetical protein
LFLYLKAILKKLKNFYFFASNWLFFLCFEIVLMCWCQK